METLADYLDRVMRQKNLDLKGLAKRSGLTESYIGRLRSGKLNNPTVAAMMKLARGLEVNAHEVFTPASGVTVSKTTSVDALLLLDHMRMIVSAPAAFDLLRQVLNVSAGKRKVIGNYLNYFTAQMKGKARPRKK